MPEESMKTLNLSDGELHLRIEEEKRQCRSISEIGECIDGEDNGRHKPFILLKDGLKNKELYENADVNIKWVAAIEGTRVAGFFLVMNFKSGGILKFDLPVKSSFIIAWLKLLVEAEGDLVIFDGSQPDIVAHNVPLDLPKKLLKNSSFVKGVQAR